MDCVFKQKKLPLLEVGDCVVAECFGAYTLAAVTEFNGIKVADAFAVLEAGDDIWFVRDFWICKLIYLIQTYKFIKFRIFTNWCN